MSIRARFLKTEVETGVEVPDHVRIVRSMPWWVWRKAFAMTLGTRWRPRIHLRDDPSDPRTVWHEAHLKQHEPTTGSDWPIDSRGGTRTRDPGIMSAVL